MPAKPEQPVNPDSRGREMPDITLQIRPGEILNIQVRVKNETRRSPGFSGLTSRLRSIWGKTDQSLQRNPFISRIGSAAFLLLALALAIFLFTRLYHLEDFPLYFYSDEASPVLTAADLLKNDLKDANQVFLPTFFWNDRKFSLGTTVYLHALSLIFLQRSVILTRLITVLLGALGLFWFSMMVLKILKIDHGWIGIFLLVSTPAWFLFSRLGLEAPIFTVFYTGFIYNYLNYRFGNHRDLLIAIILGTLAFYSYFPGQMIILITGLALLISDWKYHLKNMRVLLMGGGLLIICALPLTRFLSANPDYYQAQMLEYGILSKQGSSSLQIITNYLSRYLYGLSPVYWFNPVPHDPIWWVMKGYSHVSWMLLPFFIWGLVYAIKEWRKPEIRVILAAFFAGPVGAALISIEITRVLVMVVPILLLITLGIASALSWLKRVRLFHRSLLVITGIILTAVPFLMLLDVLQNAPTWFKDYGLDGLQWGSKEIYSAVEEINKVEPGTKIYVSDDWNWQPYIMHRFFVDGQPNIVSGNAKKFMEEFQGGLDSSLFVMTLSDYEEVKASNKFSEVVVDRSLAYPDGSPGFYFVRLRYREDAEEIFKTELLERAELVSELIKIGDQEIPIQHTILDGLKTIQNAFDGNLESLIKSDRVNPLVLDLNFPQPKTLQQVELSVGSERVVILVSAWLEDHSVREFRVDAEEGDQNKTVLVSFGDSLLVVRLRIELHDVEAQEDSFVHLWDVLIK